jgi:hypothetical protein
MHVDYEVPLTKLHLGVPMFIRPPHAVKVLHLHPDAILLFTHEVRDGAYRQAPLYQKLDLPPACRLQPARSEGKQ